MRPLIFTLGLLVLASSSPATTWRVEKDGTGDFTIIQDALDAAADGDTVLVGPGRYYDFRPYDTLNDGFQLTTIMMVRKQLLIQGAGRDSTIVGPEEIVFQFEGRDTNCIYVDQGGLSTIRGFTFTNTRGYVALGNQCVFEDNRVDSTGKLPQSAFNVQVLHGSDITIRDCEFVGPDGHLSVSSRGIPNILVEDCTFVDEEESSTNVIVRGASYGFLMRRCTIRGGDQGVQFTSGGQGTIEECDIDVGPIGAGVQVDTGFGVVRRCVIGPTRQPLRCGAGRLEVYDSIIAGGEAAGTGPGYTLFATSEVLIRNSHIGRGEDATIFVSLLPSDVVDVRENWWGTTDAAEIEASFLRNACCPDSQILFEPFALEPVSAEAESVGSFKARFRN